MVRLCGRNLYVTNANIEAKMFERESVSSSMIDGRHATSKCTILRLLSTSSTVLDLVHQSHQLERLLYCTSPLSGEVFGRIIGSASQLDRRCKANPRCAGKCTADQEGFHCISQLRTLSLYCCESLICSLTCRSRKDNARQTLQQYQQPGLFQRVLWSSSRRRTL